MEKTERKEPNALFYPQSSSMVHHWQFFTCLIIPSVIVFHKYFTNCFLSLKSIDLCGYYIWFWFRNHFYSIMLVMYLYNNMIILWARGFSFCFHQFWNLKVSRKWWTKRERNKNDKLFCLMKFQIEHVEILFIKAANILRNCFFRFRYDTFDQTKTYAFFAFAFAIQVSILPKAALTVEYFEYQYSLLYVELVSNTSYCCNVQFPLYLTGNVHNRNPVADILLWMKERTERKKPAATWKRITFVPFPMS